MAATLQSYPIADVMWRFFALLKKNGIELTPSDQMDVLRGLTHIDLGEKQQVRAALQTSIVRHPEDLSVFNRLFRIFFADTSWQDEASDSSDLQQESQQEDDLLEMPALDEVLQGDRAALQLRMQQLAQEVGLQNIQSFMQVGYFNYQMLDQMGFYAMQGQLRSSGGGGQRAQAAMEQLRQLVAAFVQQTLDGQDVRAKEDFRRKQTVEQSFLTVTPDQREAIRDEIRRLADILKTKAARRRKKQKRGTIHLHKTVRKNLMHDGVPFVRSYRDKMIRKPEIVLILDMSESVRNASEFLLLFVFSMQEVFQKVRCFIFAGNLVEITDLLRESTFEEVVAEVFSGKVLNIWASSNFGRSFEDFYTNSFDAVTPKSTVIILGDARNNYNPSRADIIWEVRHRSKKTLWLNPESKGSWGFGDSVMWDYVPNVDQAFEVSNIKQLNDFVNQLVFKK